MRHTNRCTTRPAGRAPSRRVMAGAAIAVVMTASACGGESPEPVAEPAEREAPAAADGSRPEYGLVTAEQAARLAADGVTVIDVRTPAEFADGHIEGALLFDISGDAFADQIASLDPDDEYLVYCRSGNRSGRAAALMAEIGIDRVWNLDGGVVGAEGSGLELVR
ncbi:MAG: rhodanese-like domain-containing protein [Acidimicrobiia bacterium]